MSSLSETSIPPRRAIAARLAPLLLTGLLSAVIPHLLFAQTMPLTPGGIAAGAISCILSNDETAHMVCAEYTNSGAVVGVSWEAPPGPGVPVAGLEAVGAVDPLSLGAPAGTPVGIPGCAPKFDGMGSAGCLVISSSSTGFTLQGISFSPSKSKSSGFITLDSVAPTALIGSPSCTNGMTTGQLLCVIVINHQLYGILFDLSTVNTHLRALSLGDNFEGNPGCTSIEHGATIACAIRQDNGLFGFALDAVALTPLTSLQISAGSFTNDPSCATPIDGNTATCAVVTGNTLLGVSFNPQVAHPPIIQTLGPAPDKGSWNGHVSCALVNDILLSGQPRHANLVNCVAISSMSNVFGVTFDPRMGINFGVNGPFSSDVTGTPSCLYLGADVDQTYCGSTMENGATVGTMLPVGLLPPAVARVVLSSLL